MIVKIVTIFLAVMALLAMIGRLRLPGRDTMSRLGTRKCKGCGRYRIGKGPCSCGQA